MRVLKQQLKSHFVLVSAIYEGALEIINYKCMLGSLLTVYAMLFLWKVHLTSWVNSQQLIYWTHSLSSCLSGLKINIMQKLMRKQFHFFSVGDRIKLSIMLNNEKNYLKKWS